MGLFSKDSRHLMPLKRAGQFVFAFGFSVLFLSACDNSSGSRKQLADQGKVNDQTNPQTQTGKGTDKVEGAKNSTILKLDPTKTNGTKAVEVKGKDSEKADRDQLLTTENFCANPIDITEEMKIQISEMRPYVMVVISQHLYCRFDQSLKSKEERAKLNAFKAKIISLAKKLNEQGDRTEESILALKSLKAEYDSLEISFADMIAKSESLAECARELSYVTSSIDLYLNRIANKSEDNKDQALDKKAEEIRKSNERVYKLLLMASDATLSARSFAPPEAKDQFVGAIREGNLAALRVKRLGANNKEFLATLKRFLADVKANRDAYKSLQVSGGQPAADVQQLLTVCVELQKELDALNSGS